MRWTMTGRSSSSVQARSLQWTVHVQAFPVLSHVCAEGGDESLVPVAHVSGQRACSQLRHVVAEAAEGGGPVEQRLHGRVSLEPEGCS